MIRLFQIFLASLICFYLVALLILSMGNILEWNADNPAEASLNNSDWHYSNRFGFIQLSRDYTLNPVSQKREMNSFITMPNAYPDSAENGSYYVLNQLNEKLPVRYHVKDNQLAVPVNYRQYSTVKIISVLLLIISLGAFCWLTVLLYQFTQAARKRNFFTYPTMRKLQTMGWIMVGFGAIGCLRSFFMQAIARVILQYKAINVSFEAGEYMFPSMVVGGILVLIIANAFAIGIELKEDQRLTI